MPEDTSITEQQRRIEELKKLFRRQLGNKDYKELENTWLELIGENTSFKDLLNLVDLMVRWAPPDILPPMLLVLATSLNEKGQYEEELTVLQYLAELGATDENLTQQVTACLKKLYQDEPLLERLLQKAGLGYGVPLLEALKVFNQLIKLTPNRLIYDRERGAGTVKDLDLLFDRATISFNSGTELSLDITTAIQQFSFPRKDGFCYLLKENRNRLLEIMNQDPAGTVALFLQDTGKPATPEEIQSVFEPLLGKDAYPRFWEKAKKRLSRHPNIKIQTMPLRFQAKQTSVRAYLWVEEPMLPDRAGEDERRKGGRRKVGEGRREVEEGWWTSEELQRIDSEEAINLLQSLRSSTTRKKFLEELISLRPDEWADFYARLFLADIDSRSKNIIAQALQKEKPAIWSQLVDRIFTDYRSYPEAFLFLAENFSPPSSRQILSRILDLIELNIKSPLRNKAKRLLINDNYRLIRESIKETKSATFESNEVDDWPVRFVARLKRMGILKGFQEEEVMLLTQEQAGISSPVEFSPVPGAERWLWSSAQGIEKARNELKQLLEEELPRSAEEIGRARGHGDLSENYEYKAAKEKQARLMARANRLRQELALARQIQPELIDTTKVMVGCRVKLVELNHPKEESETPEVVYEYSILGPWDSDLEKGIISFQSPLAQKLLGKKVGDIVEMGDKKLLITEISSAL